MLKDNLGQPINVGDVVAISYNLWRGKDEIRVRQVERTTAKRVYFTNGTYVTPTKVLVLNESTLEKAKDNLGAHS